MTMPFDQLRVLARPAFSNAVANPYNATIYEPIASHGIKIQEYSFMQAMMHRHHVVHVHWPETTFNHRLVEALATTQALLWLLRWQRHHGAKIMWTVHNLRAHDPRHRGSEDRFWNAFVELVDGVIVMQRENLQAIVDRFPVLETRARWIVPHPHYRGHYPDDTDREQARIRLGLDPNARTVLFFGRLYPYKNIPTLVRAFRELHDQPGRSFQLVVAGAPRNRTIANLISKEIAGDTRIRFEPNFIPPAEAQYYFRASNLVVLPYREILNSGTAHLSLSFDRPVLLPDSACCSDLRRTVGHPWIMDYDNLTAAVLNDALSSVADLPERIDGKHLSSISPERVAKATADAYRELVGPASSSGGQ